MHYLLLYPSVLLSSLGEFLTHPAAALVEPEARQKSRLLLIILLALIGSGAVVLLIETVIRSNAWADLDYWLAIAIWIIGLLLYTVARQGYTKAIATIVLVLLLLLLLIVPFMPDKMNWMPFYIVLPLILTVLSSSLRWTIIMMLLTLIFPLVMWILAVGLAGTSWHNTIADLFFILPVGCLMMAYIYHQRMVERIHLAELRGAYARVQASEAELEQRVEQRTQELRETQHRYYSLFTQTHDAVIMIDLEGNHLQANQRAAAMLGYEVAEIEKLHTLDLSAEVEQSIAVRKRLLLGEYIPTYERIFRKKDGTLIPVEMHIELVRDTAGNPLHIQSIIRDITERKRTEAALRESEKRLKMTIQSTQVGTWEWNVITGETVFNERWAEIIGYTLAELAPIDIQTWIQYSHPDDLQISNQQLAKHFAGESPTYECEVRMQHKEGHWVWVWDRGMVMEWTDDHKPLRMFGTHTDITERKQALQREFELNLEKERVRLLQQFIETASHEFRTPLSIINSNAFLIAHAPEPESRQIKKKVIETQVVKITRLVDMLLMLTKLESNLSLSFDKIDLKILFEHVVGNLQHTYGEKPKFQWRLATNLPRITANSDYLAEAFMQILDNAYRFTPPDGSITVSIHPQETHVSIEIQDSGIGIAANQLPHIFETFWRQDKAHTTAGFGLGLPIARKIIQLHQGEIQVASTTGKGSLFTILLPINRKSG